MMKNWDKIDWSEHDCSIEAVFDVDGVQVSSGHDARGREVPDPVPMAPPIGMTQGPSLVDTIRRMFQQEAFRARAAAEGFDTPEEADDFDIEDDPLDPHTAYEAHFDPAPEELRGVPEPEPSPPVDVPDVPAGGSGGTSPPTPELAKTSVPGDLSRSPKSA